MRRGKRSCTRRNNTTKWLLERIGEGDRQVSERMLVTLAVKNAGQRTGF